VVALGASNLTRGLGLVVANARAGWGPELELLAALGHGRSYGARSRVLARSLPGILQSGLWSALESRPPVATRALVTDVGNDILYGFPVEQVLGWVREVVRRLKQTTDDVAITDLPAASIRSLSRLRYLFFRTLLVPSCRLGLREVIERGEQVNAGIEELARREGLRLTRLERAWYGFDPIHFQRAARPEAWRRILGVPAASPPGICSPAETVRLYLEPPERQWLFGVERRSPGEGLSPACGGSVWLY
jgi:hypothetical protein